MHSNDFGGCAQENSGGLWLKHPMVQRENLWSAASVMTDGTDTRAMISRTLQPLSLAALAGLSLLALSRPAAAQMGPDYSRDVCSAAHQLAATMHDGSRRRPVGRSTYEQSDEIRALIAAHPTSPDMIFELTWSLTDIFFDVYNGTLQTAVEEYHDWFSTPHCTSIGLPTPFEAGIGEGLDWFRRLERDQQ